MNAVLTVEVQGRPVGELVAETAFAAVWTDIL